MAKQIAAMEESIGSITQNTNTNNVMMEATGGEIGNE
jgi:hypothetical protein